MKLFEYQAKQVFRNAGIPVPRSELARDAEAALEAAGRVGYPVVLKSQVLTGGRGKAGLIRVVSGPEEAGRVARELFDSPRRVGSLLVEEAVSIDREIYLAVTAEPVTGRALILASASGGVDIEELSARAPEKILREPVDLERGLQPFQVRNIVKSLGLEGGPAAEAAGVVNGLWKVFLERDAELAEINPLFLTAGGQLTAGDGKLVLDDNAAWRQEEFEAGREYYDSDAAYEAAREGIPYLQFDGDISLMCAGAGLTTTVYDLVIDEGGSVANYLEFGGPNYRRAEAAMKLCLQNDSKVILVVTFGTIARADVMAEGIVAAMKQLKPDRPIVTCIRGTNEEGAVEILKGAGLVPLFDTEEAVRAAVALSRGKRSGGGRPNRADRSPGGPSGAEPSEGGAS
jgi:succinyl-CoA synthetase beta subunit